MNPRVVPSTLHEGSHAKIRWKCASCGHIWDAPVRERVAGRKTCVPCNSLGATHPDIAREWHPSANAPLTPWMISPNDRRYFRWLSFRVEGVAIS